MILDDDQMPRDANGTIADVIMSQEARTNRMNIGGLYEHYFNACSYQIQRDLWSITGLHKGDRSVELKLKTMLRNEPERFYQAWERLIGYYRIVAPLQAYFFDSEELGTDAIISNMTTAITDFVYLFMPPEYAPDYMDILHECDAWCKPVYGPVTFKTDAGDWVTTYTKARIGHMLIMLLEKTADDWSAVASAKIQHYGFPAQISKTDKYGEPGRAQPIRAIGETEFRIILSYCGVLCMAEIMDRYNNSETHKQVILSLLGADKPSDIPYNIIRDHHEGHDVHPFGNTAMIQIFMHVMNVMGLGFEYISERDSDYEKIALKEQKFQQKFITA